MKKKIIIEATDVEVKEERISHKKNGYEHNKLIEWLISIVGYGIVLILVSWLFDSFHINMDYFGLYAFLGAIIIYVLNQSIKPILNMMMLPVTVLTMGLSYPVINVIILQITSLIMGKENFRIDGFFGGFVIALIISFFNILMDGFFIKPIINKRRNGRG